MKTIAALLTAAFLLIAVRAYADAPMTPAIVLIVCKTVEVGEPDANAGFTHHENRDWAYEHSMMVCRREVIEVIDSAEAADPQPFNQQRCMASAIRLATEWDLSHRGGNYRVWRVACPTPIYDTATGKIVGWQIPDCGHREVVHCEKDSVI
jgi:hypothetical protein